MGGEASEADDGADEYRHDADGGEERHVKDENKYEDELQNLSEITSQFPDNSRKTMVLAFNLEQLGIPVLEKDYSWMVPSKEINMGMVLSNDKWNLADHRLFTMNDEENLKEQDYHSWERPVYYVKRCGLGGCSIKKFPWKAGAWSSYSDTRARMGYAVHLHRHPAHQYSLRDAVRRAFDYEQTCVVFETFNQLNAYPKAPWRQQETDSDERADSFKPHEVYRIRDPTERLARRPRTPPRPCRYRRAGKYDDITAPRVHPDYFYKKLNILKMQVAVASKLSVRRDSIQQYQDELDQIISRFQALFNEFCSFDVMGRGHTDQDLSPSRAPRSVTPRRKRRRLPSPGKGRECSEDDVARSLTPRRSVIPRRRAPRSTTAQRMRNEDDGEYGLRRGARKDEDASPMRSRSRSETPPPKKRGHHDHRKRRYDGGHANMVETVMTKKMPQGYESDLHKAIFIDLGLYIYVNLAS